jgi:uncharacterized protein (UPF0276 family)
MGLEMVTVPKASSPRVGINLLMDEGYLEATLPLFEAGAVDALEWDVDERWGYGWGDDRLPRWVNELLDLYADAGALYGHGVWLSVLSAHKEPRQDRWFRLLARECKRRRYRHVSEHLGFMTAGSFVRGTMLPVPAVAEAVDVGRAVLARLARATRGPVGLENWSMALTEDDLWHQGAFLEAILEPCQGFLVLDLHNVYTQAANFGVSARQLLATLPLARVREVHVSGGSWFASRERQAAPLRLDSHDGPIPDEVFDLLSWVIPACSSLEVVFLERRAGSLADLAEVEAYRRDFWRLRSLVEKAPAPRLAEPARPDPSSVLSRRGSIDELAAYQVALVTLFAEEASVGNALQRLREEPSLRRYHDPSVQFDPRILEVTHALMGRWGARHDPELDRFRRRWPDTALPGSTQDVAKDAAAVCNNSTLFQKLVLEGVEYYAAKERACSSVKLYAPSCDE